ncbi:uncharacterized protein C8Q71DRAFT_779488 [Rhodofomes roseus]|uniref:Secreted protein n=1 Tax=Rhodofomes roseus TaxID=34475 RepID=A0ABQ8K626_9APHY|nr:uncharacterized protein C8Q71DRAFT_779488 [Rhodofomes roseus]KAH9832040.1 hypothetical protein C8Q71DRAFT_779488 [Rhodofomes roseus]
MGFMYQYVGALYIFLVASAHHMSAEYGCGRVQGRSRRTTCTPHKYDIHLYTLTAAASTRTIFSLRHLTMSGICTTLLLTSCYSRDFHSEESTAHAEYVQSVSRQHRQRYWLMYLFPQKSVKKPKSTWKCESERSLFRSVGPRQAQESCCQ